MIRYLPHNQISKKKWDDCISRSFNGNIYAWSWYLDIVSPEWCALVEEDYSRVMPLPAKEKFRIPYLFQPWFTQQLGLFSQPELHSGKLLEFLNTIPETYRLIDINLNTHNHFSEADIYLTEQLNFELDLIPAYESLSKRYSDNLKRNLQKAEKSGLSLVKGMKPEVIVDLFRKNKGKSLSHIGETQYSLLTRLAYSLIHKGMGEVWGCIDGMNQVTAGVIWANSHNKIIFLFSATSSEGRNQGAMAWLIDAMIRKRSGSSQTLDFEGSNDPNLARFYAGFGSTRVNYYRYRKNRLPWPLKVLEGIYRRLSVMIL